jgi:hypothetical protein
MRENVCIQEFVGEESYVDELGIDGKKILNLIFIKQFVVENLIKEQSTFIHIMASIAAIFMNCRSHFPSKHFKQRKLLTMGQ